MSVTKDVIAGMQILLPYYDDTDGYRTGAGHDVIYMYATDKPVSVEDIAKLKALGWHQSEVEEDDDGNAVYDADEGWQAYV